MKGLDIAEQFFNEYGKKIFTETYPELLNKVTVGLVGEGSECFGFDDDLSHDHDFEPGFCIFINKNDEDEIGFKLERAYAKLPKEFMGLKRMPMSPVGGNRHGVITVEDFYKKFLGNDSAPDSIRRWLYTPSFSLASACNGRIFSTFDDSKFMKVRNELVKGYPLDIRKKKISAHLVFMGQSGQYNYGRCIDRNERGSAGLACFEFVKHAVSVVYLLNNQYEPFYKWALPGMRKLDILSDLEFSLSGLIEIGNNNKEATEKREIIEDIATMIISELKNQNLTDATCNNLETHAYSVQDKIENADLRNMHIMEGV